MFYLICMILLAIAFVIALGVAFNTQDPDVKTGAGIAAIVVVVGAVLWTLGESIMIVSVGNVNVLSVFGTVSQTTYAQGGPYLVNPMSSSQSMTVQQRNIIFQSNGQADDESRVTSSNNLVLTMDVTYEYALNPTYAWVIRKNYGDDNTYEKNLVAPAAANATRNATAEVTSDQATTTGHEQLAQGMAKQFKQLLVANLMQFGVPKDVAEQTFIILPVQLRKVLPPATVQQSIENKVAALQDLARQQTLTSIAEEVAKRRKQEGEGVSQLFGALPKGFSPSEISTVLGALATKERADALTKAVETNRMGMTIFGADPQVAVAPSGK